VLNNLKSQLASLVALGQHLRRTTQERQAELRKFDADLVQVRYLLDAAASQ
jgi:hypothetical protein